MRGYNCFQRHLSTLTINFCSNHLGSQGVRVSTTTTKGTVIITVPHCYDITQDTIHAHVYSPGQNQTEDARRHYNEAKVEAKRVVRRDKNEEWVQLERELEKDAWF